VSTRGSWFTAAQFEGAARPGAPARAAGSQPWIARAKQMGTNLTACGENAFTFAKLWHVPFEKAGPSRCRSCVDVLLPLARPQSREDHQGEGR
jgi:hypothetical protein